MNLGTVEPLGNLTMSAFCTRGNLVHMRWVATVTIYQILDIGSLLNIKHHVHQNGLTKGRGTEILQLDPKVAVVTTAQPQVYHFPRKKIGEINFHLSHISCGGEYKLLEE